MQREILVFIALGGNDVGVGRLWSRDSAGRKTSSFVYDAAWLTQPHRFALSPYLPLASGTQHFDTALPAAFTDCAPDSWGMKLMRRAERMAAETAGRAARTLLDADFLLGVDDASRMGALRFKEPGGSAFLSASKRPVPPLIDLPKLFGAADRFDQGKENERDIALVLAPGASLGGARPKATIRDTDGSLLIAKFVKNDDEWPVIAWEAVALELAGRAGITLARWRLKPVGNKPVLLMHRFDRDDGRRMPYMSALTALDARDHDRDNRSYLDIAEFIRRESDQPKLDLEQLWRRIVFNILISNTDDHLRNHGFLHLGQGWRLSPAFDMNPTPSDVKPRVHQLAINEDDPTASLRLALDVAPKYGIGKAEARTLAAEVGAAVGHWAEVAKKHKLNAAQIARMASAFEHQDLALARALPATEHITAKASGTRKQSGKGKRKQSR